jgi:hypothetical protein
MAMADKKLGDEAIILTSPTGKKMEFKRRDESDSQWADLTENAIKNGHAVRSGNITQMSDEALSADPEHIENERAVAEKNHNRNAKRMQARADILKSGAAEVARTSDDPYEEDAQTTGNLVPTNTPHADAAKEMLKNVGETIAGVASDAMNPIGAVTKGIEGLVKKGVEAQPGKQPELVAPEVAPKPGEPVAEKAGAAMPMMAGSPEAVPSSGIEPVKNYRDEMVEGEKQSTEALVQEAGVKAMAQQRLGQVQLLRQEENERYAAGVMDIERKKQEDYALYKQQLSDLQGEIAKLDPTVDPNRYWKNKTGGQLALGAITGALMGFAGKGIDYMHQINAEVERDVDGQKTTYLNADRKLQRQMALAGDQFALAKEAGLSNAEASAKAHISKLASLDSYLNAVTANNTSAELMANAQVLRAGLAGRIAEKAQAGDMAAQERSSKRTAERTALLNADTARREQKTHEFMAETDRMFKNAKLAAAGSKGGAKPPAAVTKQLQGYDETLIELKNMRKLADVGNLRKLNRATVNFNPGSALPGVSDVNFPGTGSFSDAKAENAEWQAMREKILVAMTHASIKENDERRLKDILNNPNSLSEAGVKEIDAIMKRIGDQREAFVKNNKAYDLSGNSEMETSERPTADAEEVE